MDERDYTPTDTLLLQIDRGLRTVFGRPQTSERPDPADKIPEGILSEKERQQAAALMRINHAGEVAAQALYQGQALSARLDKVRERMERAAIEENDHLAWCEQRCYQLGSHTSYLNPVWYCGSLLIGTLAGACGDRWSLGFIVETENQVVRHLNEHLQTLPAGDDKSRAILEQMKIDEQHHAIAALEAGAAKLPAAIKRLMHLTAKIMTHSTAKI